MSYNTERAKYFAENARCTRCGKQDDYTLSGRRLCRVCAEKCRKDSKKYYEKHGGNPGDKKRYQKLKESGLCVDCGKYEAKNGSVRCEDCLLKRKKLAMKRGANK